MTTVLLQSLLLASSGLLSIGSITLVILLLISDRGWKNGLGYALGYFTAYSLIGISAVSIGYHRTQNNVGEESKILPAMLIFFGALLLWLALKNWRKPVESEKKEPRFFSIVNKITPLKAFGFGALVSVINFKNLALFITALSVVILSDLGLPQKLIITLSVVFVFCLSVIIPVLIYLIFPKKSDYLLNGIKDGIEKYSRPIGIWLPLLFGLIFLFKGITGLL